MSIDILLIEDDPEHSELVKRAFDTRGDDFNLTIVSTIEAARQQIINQPPALVIADWLLPDGESLQLVKDKDFRTSIPLVLMTSHGNEQVAVDAIKAGILDYIVKSDQTLADMPHIADRAMREWDLLTQRKNTELVLQQRVTELEAINKISTLLRSADSVDTMLPQLLDETLSIMGRSDASIWLYQTNTGNLERACARGHFLGVECKKIIPGNHVLGAILNQDHKDHSKLGKNSNITKELGNCLPPGWKSIILPIRAGNQAVGIFSVAAPPDSPLDESRLYLLSTLCEIAGNAIHRLRLHEQTRHNLNRMAALHTIDLAISASVDFHPTLDIILNQSFVHLAADAAVFYKLNHITNQLEVVAWQGFQRPPNSQVPVDLSDRFIGQALKERRLISIPNIAHPQSDHYWQGFFEGDFFSACHAIPLIAKGQVKGVFAVFHRKPFYPDREWQEFLESLASQAAISIDNIELFDNLQRSNQDLRLAYDATIEGWSYALDLRDQETEGHTRRVVEMTVQLSKLIGIGDEDLIHIRRGALLHDIGKMGIPDQILLKPSELTEREWATMRQHPVYAYDMLSSVYYLRKALEIPYCHHEYWNGRGYPRALAGEQIPLSARIFALTDVWDALNSDRPYRSAWPRKKALAYMRKMSGLQFDPDLVPKFLEMLNYVEVDK